MPFTSLAVNELLDKKVSTTEIFSENTSLPIPYQEIDTPNFFDKLLLDEDKFFAPVVNPVLTVLSGITDFIADSYNQVSQWTEANFVNINRLITNGVDEIRGNFSELRQITKLEFIIDKLKDIVDADDKHEFLDTIKTALEARIVTKLEKIITNNPGLS